MPAKKHEAFICYRRQDTQSIVGWLYADLARDLGRDRVFKDTDSVPYGVSFSAHIASVLAGCRVVLVVIGARWLDAGAGDERARLFDDEDHVRAEISAARAAGAAILPLLYASATMPAKRRIPQDIEYLSQLNARPLREDPDYRRDYEEILLWIRSELANKRPKAPTLRQDSAGVDYKRVPRRLLVALSAGALTIAGVGVFEARRMRHDFEQKTVEQNTVEQKPPSQPPALGDILKRVEGVLEDGDTIAARLALERQLAQYPADARIHYMLGRVAFAEERNGDGLTRYREAITLDPGFRGDPLLLSHVESASAEPKNADAALDLMIDKIGAPATDLLAKVANEGNDLPRRQRAARALEEMGHKNLVDGVGLAILQLKKARACDERKAFVEQLREYGDPRALPALRALRGQTLGNLIRFGGTDTACMKKELPAAIKELEKKPGASDYQQQGSHAQSATPSEATNANRKPERRRPEGPRETTERTYRTRYNLKAMMVPDPSQLPPTSR